MHWNGNLNGNCKAEGQMVNNTVSTHLDRFQVIYKQAQQSHIPEDGKTNNHNNDETTNRINYIDRMFDTDIKCAVAQ